MNKLNCIKKKVEEDELEVLTFLENKFSKINKKLEKKIFGVLKNKYIKEINSLNYAKEIVSNNYIIEKKNLDNLIKIKNNLTTYIKMNENNYIDNLKKIINPDLLCNICYENRCNIVLNPCGHIFCDKCFTNNNLTCFVCRKSVDNCIKIFMN